MNEEQRENIKKANRRRTSRLCPKCGGSDVYVCDGKDCHGMPGINYRVCPGCGWAMAIVHRQRKHKL